ncbi:RimK family alpha-L-glutamate ligase [Anaeromyxobacter terrae]|uniref:RimK family alpha-L-glutamate ligase n=1 Tax=Anaeromyxobacter terrae TaxID=2925406 RepID=UPI001F59AD2A|nr:RimK family alpha-L-glutamate ligase [Anaeromyxobacter sp. SG22]
MNDVIRIGIVTAWPEDDWHSKRLVSACARHGEAAVIDPAELSAIVDSDGVVSVTAEGREGETFDAFVLARGMGRAGDADVQFEIYRALEDAGAVVVNRIDPLLAAQDKFRTSWLLARAGVRTPRAAVAQTARGAEGALAALGEAVVKPIAGSLGDGVERLRADTSGRAVVRERLAREGAVYLQSYVPHPGRDVRVFVVGGRARAAIERHAPPGDWRTNVATGGRAEAVPLGSRLAAVAEAAASAIGLDYAGIDVVVGPEGPTVIEVNGNPSWQGILEATGLDMAEAIAEHVLGRALRRRVASDHIVPDWTGATNG